MAKPEKSLVPVPLKDKTIVVLESSRDLLARTKLARLETEKRNVDEGRHHLGCLHGLLNLAKFGLDFIPTPDAFGYAYTTADVIGTLEVLTGREAPFFKAPRIDTPDRYLRAIAVAAPFPYVLGHKMLDILRVHLEDTTHPTIFVDQDPRRAEAEKRGLPIGRPLSEVALFLEATQKLDEIKDAQNSSQPIAQRIQLAGLGLIRDSFVKPSEAEIKTAKAVNGLLVLGGLSAVLVGTLSWAQAVLGIPEAVGSSLQTALNYQAISQVGLEQYLTSVFQPLSSQFGLVFELWAKDLLALGATWLTFYANPWREIPIRSSFLQPRLGKLIEALGRGLNKIS